MKRIMILFLAMFFSQLGFSHSLLGSENPGRTLVAPPQDSEECRDFVNFATQRAVDPKYISVSRSKLAPFQTDGLVVIQNGKTVYEWYDGLINENTPHILWSASKDVTVALVARTIQEKYTYHGKPFTLQTKVSDFYSLNEVENLNPAIKTSVKMQNDYQSMTVENLVAMAAGFNWNESYDDDLKNSSFMPMLYLNGRSDMSQFALATPLSPEGPGQRWDYSGGNMNILMDILKKIHGADYVTMPDRLLYGPLGMRDVRMETDGSGKYVGSSYIYMRLQDMAKFGQLYLQKGLWNQKQMFPEGWLESAQEVNSAIFSKATTLDVIKSEGTGSNRVFWLNKDVYRDDGKIFHDAQGRPVAKPILYPQEMPQAPAMFFAAGHYGQLIIIIPEMNVVIARTGYDQDYWDHVQPLVVKALSCVRPGYKPNEVADLTPPRADAKSGFLGGFFHTVSQVPTELSTVGYLKESGLDSAIISKEMCSFLFTMNTIDAIPQGQEASTYLSRAGLPNILTQILKSHLDIFTDRVNKRVQVGRYNPNQDPGVDPGDHLYQDLYEAKMSPDPSRGCSLRQIDVKPINDQRRSRLPLDGSF